MRLGVSLHPTWPTADHTGELALAMARKADELGFHHIRVGSHVIGGQMDVTGQDLDPLVFLPAIAAVTTRIAVFPSVLVLPYHQPVMLANQLTSLDVLSAGRLIVGVGVGWDRAEYAALGVPFAERGARTDEYLEIMRALWRGSSVDFDGRFVTLREVSLAVPSRTPEGPPLWIGGHSDAALRRVVRFGTAWHASGGDHVELRRMRERLAGFAEQAGRDPATIELTSGHFLVPPGLRQVGEAPGELLGGRNPSAEQVRTEFGLLQDAGLTASSIWLPIEGAAMGDALDWLAEEILPALGDAEAGSTA